MTKMAIAGFSFTNEWPDAQRNTSALARMSKGRTLFYFIIVWTMFAHNFAFSSIEGADRGQSTKDPKTCENFLSLRSELARKSGILFLIHRTPIENLLKSLQAQSLQVSKSYYKKIFLEAIGPRYAKRHALREGISATLIFDLTPLDSNVHYHISSGWDAGALWSPEHPNRGSALFDNLSKIQILFESFVKNGSSNEIVFYDDLPLTGLREIWVSRSDRKVLIDKIEADEIVPVSNIPWSKLIKTR